MFTHPKRSRVFLAMLPAALAICVLCAGLALAKKPAPKPPPEPGTIYFRVSGGLETGLWAMSADGSSMWANFPELLPLLLAGEVVQIALDWLFAWVWMRWKERDAR